ncbi:MAG: YqaJ viral recombinase family protein [Bacteroidales bacterium]|nr:YqaJ viral recombinase family protein [Bacteroidales bacterium]
MSIVRHEYKTRDEWLSLRAKMDDRLGGSEIGVAAGNSDYDSAYSMFCKKVGLIQEKDISLNEPVVQGHDFEDKVAQRFSRISGKRVYEDSCIYTNDDFPHLKATPDRLLADEDSGHECKTAQRDAWSRNETGDFPITYFNQCCLYMAVTQRKRWYLSALVYGTAFKTFLMTRVKSEAERYSEMKEKFDGLFSDEQKRRYVLPFEERVAYFGEFRDSLVPEGVEDAESWKTEYEEWVRDWCYLEAVYYIDEDELKACEDVAAQFLNRKKAVEEYMASQTWKNEDERKILLVSAVSQVWPHDEIDASEATTEAINELYPESVPGSVVALDGACVTNAEGVESGKSYRELLEDRAEAMRMIEELEERKTAIENALAAKMGSAEKASLEGWTISRKSSTTLRPCMDLIKRHFGGEIPRGLCVETSSRRWYIRQKKAK